MSGKDKTKEQCNKENRSRHVKDSISDNQIALVEPYWKSYLSTVQASRRQIKNLNTPSGSTLQSCSNFKKQNVWFHTEYTCLSYVETEISQ